MTDGWSGDQAISPTSSMMDYLNEPSGHSGAPSPRIMDDNNLFTMNANIEGS
ncbi:hypothetical protein BGZ65_012063, partial [Modicella reniformis]